MEIFLWLCLVKYALVRAELVEPNFGQPEFEITVEDVELGDADRWFDDVK